MDEELKVYLEGMEQRAKQQSQALSTLVESVKESLERDIQGVGDRVDRMSARLDKIAAGSHYVTRLVEWSEKQDRFQEDILKRVAALEARFDKR
jgi:septal ring factor EnvC (AmiA/AmiB activator)